MAGLADELQGRVRRLVDDLRGRADAVPEVAAVVDREWARARDAERTALAVGPWREGLLDEVAVAWVLNTTFLRFCEDNGLLAEPVLSGPGHRRARAEAAQTAWLRGSAAGERDYVVHAVTEAARLPGLAHVFDGHNPFWLFGPSEDAVRDLLAFWREVDPDRGDLRRDLTDETLDTRFLGDLYQDLSEQARDRFALLQTPEFVERFILDRTLVPALDTFGLDGFRMIDPACGSGHFLLGAFDELLDRWRDRAPQEGVRALAERSLASIHGVDANAAAAAIARFRLLVAALRASRVDDAPVPPLAEAPNFTLNVVVGDSLLHAPPHQQVLTGVAQASRASAHTYATEDRDTLHRFLGEQRYHAVVANPPYIVPKDPAANSAYRDLYPGVCSGQYPLAVPFMDRLFFLAARSDDGEPAGFVGQITANTFMKRKFGKKLIESYLRREVDLTHVVDTESLNIGGHGTATVILLGRNRVPVGDTVRAVLGIQGDRAARDYPAKSAVWKSILDLLDKPGVENDYITVTDIDRDRLAKHPWSLQGGGAVELKELLDASQMPLGSRIEWPIGRAVRIGADDAFVASFAAAKRRNLPCLKPLLEGKGVRDWMVQTSMSVVYPYNCSYMSSVRSALWSFRTLLAQRRTFEGVMADSGLRWFEYQQHTASAYKSDLSACFANVATHNHFVLDRGGVVFSSHAPVIKLSEGASEDDYLELLGPLNSTVGCFWMKQVFYSKGAGGVNEGFKAESWERFREFDGTKLKQFPLPKGSALAWAKRLDGLAQELADNLPAALVARGAPTRDDLDTAHKRVDEIRAEMVGVQEELDWRCLHLYGVTDEDLSLDPEHAVPLERGQRAFEIALARKKANGEVETTWFTRHDAAPVTEVPDHWPESYRDLVARRIALIGEDRFVGLVERPEHKRRWNWDDWGDLETAALRSWLLDRMEQPDCWPQAKPQSARELADRLRTDPDVLRVATLLDGPEVDPTELVARLVRDETVPYLAARRHTASGLRKRAQWEEVWDLQRREDAGETLDPPIPVPPKYTKADFTGQAWRHRGKLDVPKERFVAYPGAGHPGDPTPLVGWAGWDHLRQAQALATLYQERHTRDGWPAEDLVPLLAGLRELVPWVRQWHNDVDPATGERLGDFFAGYVTGQAQKLGVSPEELA